MTQKEVVLKTITLSPALSRGLDITRAIAYHLKTRAQSGRGKKTEGSKKDKNRGIAKFY
ncbi:MAG: hypothetical protein K0M45_07600 [Candidatus Paracaedibacteraceae bacterium]|nr:hypothetical protein [Candidatus Paracaedibacteraceae bacterium]